MRQKAPSRPLALWKCAVSGASNIWRMLGGSQPATYLLKSLCGELAISRMRFAACLFSSSSSFLCTILDVIHRLADSTRSMASSLLAYFFLSFAVAFCTWSREESAAMPRVLYMRIHSRLLSRSAGPLCEPPPNLEVIQFRGRVAVAAAAVRPSRSVGARLRPHRGALVVGTPAGGATAKSVGAEWSAAASAARQATLGRARRVAARRRLQFGAIASRERPSDHQTVP
mmetsp:Transcript_26574/g.79261  ORF Transcript_26574/g.79261 Transcript_26574/m.79261 type:complete len:228 (-) Transcript_26574:11-694(-)